MYDKQYALYNIINKYKCFHELYSSWVHLCRIGQYLLEGLVWLLLFIYLWECERHILFSTEIFVNTEYFISIKLSVKGTHQKLVFTEFERGPE